jgi:hypothetical protein
VTVSVMSDEVNGYYVKSQYIDLYIYMYVYIYVSSDARIKRNIVDVNDDTALDKILNIQPKTYEYKDVINRGTKKVHGFISQ